MHIYPESLSPPKCINSKDPRFTSPGKNFFYFMTFMKGGLHSKLMRVHTGYDTLILNSSQFSMTREIFIFFGVL